MRFPWSFGMISTLIVLPHSNECITIKRLFQGMLGNGWKMGVYNNWAVEDLAVSKELELGSLIKSWSSVLQYSLIQLIEVLV